jgi:hypothetical protein
MVGEGSRIGKNKKVESFIVSCDASISLSLIMKYVGRTTGTSWKTSNDLLVALGKVDRRIQ